MLVGKKERYTRSWLRDDKEVEQKCSSVEKLHELVVTEQPLNTLPRVWVQERKPTTNSEAEITICRLGASTSSSKGQVNRVPEGD